MRIDGSLMSSMEVFGGSMEVRGRVRLDKTTVLARVERQHQLIEALRSHAPRTLTGAELADRLGVSRRTIERDAADLVDAGVPLTIRRGAHGGSRIDHRARLPEITLTPGEAAAIISSMVGVGPFRSATAQSALAKIVAAFGEPGAASSAPTRLPASAS
jgi:predicted DNA-binding transcriptional regulator YafY